jgi:type IV pilus assembly protein PilN
MIRINLLGTERQTTRRVKVPSFDLARRLTLACSLILVAAGVGIGWWYWSLNREAAQVEAEIATRHQEAARLQSLLAEVQRFEAQRAQLQQRVQLIEQLRSGQSVPVQLLDHVSRSLPDMMWLTDLTQDGADVSIKGLSTTLIGLSDFVGNLGNGALLKKPIEIVDSQVDAGRGGAPGSQPVELINFTVKAELAAAGRSGPATPAAPTGRGAAPAGRGAAPTAR